MARTADSQGTADSRGSAATVAGPARSRLRRRLLGGSRVPAHLRNRRQRFFGYLGGMWDVAAFAYLALAGLMLISRRVGGGVVPVLLQPLQATLPFVVLPSALVVVVGILGRRGLQVGLAAGVAVSGWFAVAPARRTLAPAPKVAVRWTLFDANLYEGNRHLPELAEVIRSANTDLVALQELTPTIGTFLDAQNSFAAYPYRLSIPRSDGFGAGLFSKYPLVTAGERGADAAVSAVVERPGALPLQVRVVHPRAPLDGPTARTWTAEMGALKGWATGLTAPTVIVGDFNGTRWQPPFGELLGAGGIDAHEALGKGLTMSWPMQAEPLRPFTRLDHALLWHGARPVAVRDIEVPGSDHRGFVLTFGTPAAESTRETQP